MYTLRTLVAVVNVYTELSVHTMDCCCTHRNRTWDNVGVADAEPDVDQSVNWNVRNALS